jgi:hypothetical protein
MTKEALQLALDAFEDIVEITTDKGDYGDNQSPGSKLYEARGYAMGALEYIKEALAQPEQPGQGSDAAKAAHMLDLYDTLGVRWGDDPFTVIAKMRQQYERAQPGHEYYDIRFHPSRWTQEMHDAWHQAIPDIDKAFAAIEKFNK